MSGRGPQLVVPDLLAALDAGRLAEAVLDVTDPEPLPPEHPLWSHPRVRITPHIASMTQPASAARVVIDNLRRFARGEPLVGLVDRARGLLSAWPQHDLRKARSTTTASGRSRAQCSTTVRAGAPKLRCIEIHSEEAHELLHHSSRP